jgi:hypothetical protein
MAYLLACPLLTKVVQHKTERFRGVITGWQRAENNQSNKPSSLTKKDYGEGEEAPAATDDIQSDIQYTMILDSGDAHLLGGASQVNSVIGAPVAMQSELEEVKDDWWELPLSNLVCQLRCISLVVSLFTA